MEVPDRCASAFAVKLLTQQEDTIMEHDRFQELVLSELSDIKDRISGMEQRLPKALLRLRFWKDRHQV